MTTTYYKAVRPDGTDFHSGTVQWDVIGSVVRHPTSHKVEDDPSTYLSVSTVPTDCTGMQWPCRLLTVEPVSPVEAPDEDLPHKRATLAWKVIGELDPCTALGPQGREVAALIDRASCLTANEARRLSAAWYAAGETARDTAWDAARDTAWYAAGDTAWYAAGDTAWYAAGDTAWDAAWDAASRAAEDAAQALVVRDLISDENFQFFTQPWRDVIGDL